MTRARAVPALLAALAGLAVTLPLRVLFAPDVWLSWAVVAVGSVAVSGAALRVLVGRAPLVVGGQLLLGAWALAAFAVPETLWYAVPTPATARAVAAAVAETAHAVATSAAPVRVTAGVALALAVTIAVVALIVDLVAVTLTSPAAAGMPLLAAYAAIAANTGTGLPMGYFIGPALAWVLLVGHDGVDRFAPANRAIAKVRTHGGPRPRETLWATVRWSVALALLTALALPALLPHATPTFLADGLGRGAPGGGGSSLDTSLAVARSLGDRSPTPVLRYTTDSRTPPPLRVDVLSSYTSGMWLKAHPAAESASLPPNEAGPGIERRRFTTTVSLNELRRPQLAVPGIPTEVSMTEDRWLVDSRGVVHATSDSLPYTVRAEENNPTTAQLLTVTAGDPGDHAGDLSLTGVDRSYLDAIIDEILPQARPPAETAWAIQEYLRSSRFTYALDLADPVTVDDVGRPLSDDALTQFLATRRGYCVQFATAMALMARSRDIPARVAIGYLPGTLEGDTWTVRAADAHAWPELYFAGIGWVRFEPTPGTHAGPAPAWTIAPASTTPDATPSASPTARPSSTPTGAAPTSPEAAPQTADASGPSGAWLWLRQRWWLLTAALGALLAVGATPIAAWVRRRRALHRAADPAERTELLWDSLLERLADLGIVPPTGATPRQAEADLHRAIPLDDDSATALATVVSTLERARYAAHPGSLPDVAEAADLVRTAAYRSRPLRTRLRARCWPLSGRRAWSDLGTWRPRCRRGRRREASAPDQSR